MIPFYKILYYLRRKKLRVPFLRNFFRGPEDLSGIWIIRGMGTLVRGASGLLRADAVCAHASDNPNSAKDLGVVLFL